MQIEQSDHQRRGIHDLSPATTQASITPGSGAALRRAENAQPDMWHLPNVAERYARFAEHDWYQQVNSSLVDLLPLQDHFHVLDAGSGIGSGSQLFDGKVRRVTGVDISEEMVRYAAEKVQGRDTAFNFVVGDITDLSQSVNAPVDIAVAFNAFHLFQHRARFLQSLSENLSEGGIFAFNTGILQDAVSAEHLNDTTTVFRSVRDAAQELLPKKSGAVVREWGNPVAPSSTRLIETVERSGFTVLHADFVDTFLDKESIIDYLTIPGVGSAVLAQTPDHKLRQQIYRQGVEASGLEGIRRRWFNLVAEKG